jgi:hypothetical protein
MSVAGVTFLPEPRRAAPERAARPSEEEASFSRALDEAEPRDESDEPRSTEAPARRPAEQPSEAAPEQLRTASVAPIEQPPGDPAAEAVRLLSEAPFGEQVGPAPSESAAPAADLLAGLQPGGRDAAPLASAG